MNRTSQGISVTHLKSLSAKGPEKVVTSTGYEGVRAVEENTETGEFTVRFRYQAPVRGESWPASGLAVVETVFHVDQRGRPSLHDERAVRDELIMPDRDFDRYISSVDCERVVQARAVSGPASFN